MMKTILLVEDNPTDVLLTRKVFSRAEIPAELVVASDGVQALEMLDGLSSADVMKELALILMDINMPRKDGRQTLQEIKQNTDLCRIPVVMLTTSDSGADVNFSYQNHASGYIVKPASMDSFTAAVASLKHFWLETVTLPTSTEH